MTRIQDSLRALFAPHLHAERLIDARLDARRGGPPLDAEQAAWLEAHLEGCVRCQQVAEARAEVVQALTQTPPLRAPEGFAARVLEAARAESRAPAPVRYEPERRPWLQWGFAGAAVAATVAFAVMVRPPGAPSEGPGVEVSGAAAVAAEAPDFDVRAPGLGAAEIRAVVSRIASAHSGTVEGSKRVLTVRIPRAELVGMLRDLSRAGEVSVTPRDKLDPERETVVLRVNLD